MCPFSSTSIASLSFGKYKSIRYLKTQCCGSILSFENVFSIFVVIDALLLIVISCNLNPNLLLKSFLI